ncbi:MAG: hypothetical protein HYX47_21330 [Burkholderiales bacterium]|nr:hypothetical protein [Burkholderiales bacterium]
MKALLLIVLAVSGLAGCVAYPVNGYGYGYSDPSVTVYSQPGYYGSRRDRDGDGVPNRWDRRPNDPRRQ